MYIYLQMILNTFIKSYGKHKIYFGTYDNLNNWSAFVIFYCIDLLLIILPNNVLILSWVNWGLKVLIFFSKKRGASAYSNTFGKNKSNNYWILSGSY